MLIVARNMHLLRMVIIGTILHATLSKQLTNSPDDYCQYEHFQPRCMKNEAILMKSATYGRMRIGRCITAKEVEAHRSAVGDDPRYFGCSADILSIMDRKCSGKTDCDVHVIDLSLEELEPCFPGLSGYLEVSYHCISVADEERSCSISASHFPTHVTSRSADGSKQICGIKFQPWTVEAPVGQKISIGLLDFNISILGQTERQSRRICHTYGVIIDKTSKRNVTICGGGTQREKELYKSAGNTVDILVNEFHPKEDVTNAVQFVLRIEAVGCVDLIPPEDAWLKRSDDSIVIGCYSSRQTWHLHCEGEKWIGVFGNCSQARDPVVELEPKFESWNDEQVLTLVAVGGFTLTICLVVLCTGIVCFRRYSAQSKKRQDYRTLNFQVNSTRSQQIESTTVSGNTGSDRAANEMPTYSVFVGESDFNDIDNNCPHDFNSTNSRAPL